MIIFFWGGGGGGLGFNSQHKMADMRESQPKKVAINAITSSCLRCT